PPPPTHFSRASHPVLPDGADDASGAGADDAAAEPPPPPPTHFSRASQPVLPDGADDASAAGAPADSPDPPPTHFSRASHPVFWAPPANGGRKRRGVIDSSIGWVTRAGRDVFVPRRTNLR